MNIVQLETVSLQDAEMLHPGEILCRHTASVLGSEVTIMYAVDAAEHKRRERVGLTAIEDERDLATLLALPMHDLSAVPSRFLDSAAQLASTREGVVELVTDPDGDVWGQRLADVPVRIVEIRISASRWARAIRTAHLWNGYGRRRIVMTTPLRNEQAAATEASYYGIGLTIQESLGYRDVVEAADYAPRRFTTSRWLVAETVYRQFAHAIRHPRHS
ncbi:hypothetical protein [Curtobacterium sp. Arg-1]|uniref:hypothetical protein n=1 Tax=Curtobacterium sp. Arg-1 TaxID=2935040 RepID=UPI0021D861DE|nr:hypothetical protein [Curtobacterium sp. Arg-1]UXZ56567.1 hypothetical protein MXD64_11025 [Curtobacterium sp. Arg-1]